MHPFAARRVPRSNSVSGGEGGIRTHGTLRYNGFRDRPIQPLSHLSADLERSTCSANTEQNRWINEDAFEAKIFYHGHGTLPADGAKRAGLW